MVIKFVCGKIKIGIRNLIPDPEFFTTAGCSFFKNNLINFILVRGRGRGKKPPIPLLSIN